MRGAQLVALCDNDGPKARALADRFGVPDAFTDIDELLEFDEIGALCRERSIVFHCDAVQALGRMGVPRTLGFGP